MFSTLSKAKTFYRRSGIPLDHYVALVEFLRDDKKIFSVTNTQPNLVVLVRRSLPLGELIAYGIYGKRNFYQGLYDYYLSHNCSFQDLESRLFCKHSLITSVTDGKFKSVIECFECEVPYHQPLH
jgi:hypothetical protein